MRIGFIQPAYPATASPDPTTTIESLFHELARSACDLIVLPEYANVPGMSDPAEMLQRAEAEAGAFLSRVAATARRCHCAIAVNTLSILDAGPANVTWLIDEQGNTIGRYVKAHLTPFERDALKLVPGQEATVAQWKGLRVGFLTCFDVYFTEFAERLAALKPDIVALPSYQRAESGDVLLRQAAGRALDIEAYIVRASYSMGSGAACGGHSLIAAPDGSILVNAGQETGLFAADITPQQKRLRPQAFGMPALPSRQIVEAHRRPWLYRPAGFGVGTKTAAAYPRVVAHRGLSGACPENTLPAFAAAIALGADEIELDLWASSDGELVVCHDPQVDRTSNGHGLIRDLSWAEIQTLDAGSWRGPDWTGIPFCRLEDVLDQFGGKIVMNIHIKETGDDGLVVRRTRELAAQRGLLSDIYIAGDRDVLECAIKYAPDVARCCLAEASVGARMLDCALEYGCARVQFWNPNVTPEDIERAHANGIICNLFFGNRPDTPEEATRMCNLGIDAVLTNWANKVLPAVRALPTRPREG